MSEEFGKYVAKTKYSLTVSNTFVEKEAELLINAYIFQSVLMES